jgi:hypothetical protein
VYIAEFGKGEGCGGKVVARITMSSMKPFLTHLTRRLLIILSIIIWVTNLFCHLFIPYSTNAQAGQKRLVNDEVFIYQIAPDKRGGKAYKLVYLVEVPIDVFWKFKTDFDNDFLVKNKFIRKHNFISQNGNTFITEFPMADHGVPGNIPVGFCSPESETMPTEIPLWVYTAGVDSRRNPGYPGGLFRLLGCFPLGELSLEGGYERFFVLHGTLGTGDHIAFRRPI